MIYTKDWGKLKRRIISLYENGFSLREIAFQIGTSHTTINKRLSLWGELRRTTDQRRRGGRKQHPDLSGRRFGQLFVFGKEPTIYPMKYIVRCDCGKMLSLTRKQILKKIDCGHNR